MPRAEEIARYLHDRGAGGSEHYAFIIDRSEKGLELLTRLRNAPPGRIGVPGTRLRSGHQSLGRIRLRICHHLGNLRLLRRSHDTDAGHGYPPPEGNPCRH